MPKTTTCFSARKRLIVVAVSACFASAPTWANPTAPQVVNGAASFNQAGNLLTVTNTNGAIINWNSFSIGANETTRFNQTSAGSSVLNRVVANDPSVLLGTLSSNGTVWLVNPAGIMVGQGARIDVAGFVASTLKVSNEDFLAGRLNFGAVPDAGSIQNYGRIATPSGGSVYLIAPEVENHGIINAPNGEVLLAAGKTVQLVDTGTPGVQVEITGSEGSATNLGEIVAEAGRIGMGGVLVRNSGTLNASSVVKEGGRVFLKASRDAYLDGAGHVLANGAIGGRIEVLGDRVAVMNDASLDATGQNAGGTVLVGGDAHGANPDIQNAKVAYFGAGAQINADAVRQGNGGRVIVWADDTTRAYGSISARGGADGGNGGFIETSGRRFLDFQGRADTGSPKGESGTLLLDPETINISSSSDANISTSSPFVSQTGGTSTLNVSTLQGALAGGNVTIDTTGGVSGNGDINLQTNLDYNGVGTKTLTMNAYRNINLSYNIADSVPGGDTLNLDLRPGYQSGTGTATLSGTNIEAGNLTVNTGSGGTGNLTISGTTKVAGVLDATNLALSVGTLEMNGATGAERTVTVGSGTTWSWHASTVKNAVLNIDAGGALNISGTVVFDGTVTSNAGIVNIDNGYLNLKGAATLDNSGTVNLYGTYDLGLYDTTGLTNAAGGTIDFKADGSQLYVSNAYQSASTPTITNHGSIVKSGGTGTSYLTQYYRNNNGSVAYPDFLVSDGSISAASGTLQIQGNASYNTGASFGAAGSNGNGIYFYDGIQTLNASQTLNALTVNTDVKGTGVLTVADGGTLIWNSGTYSGAGLNVAAGGTLNLVGTLTMNGTALANAGTVNLNTGYLDLKSSATLANSGTVNLTGGYDLRLYDTASATNAAAGTIDLKADSSYIYAYNAYQSTSTPTLTNHGSIVKSAGTGTSYLSQYYRNNNGSVAYPDFLVSDGRISATSGTLQIAGNASYDTGASFGASGANGSGIYFYDGIQTLNASQALNALTVNTDVKGTGSLTVADAGILTWNSGIYSGAGLNVAAGGTLNLVGTLTMDGSALANAGTVNLNTGYLYLKSTATLANNGTVNLAGGYDLNLYDSTSMTNAVGGTIDLKADGSQLYVSNTYQSASTPTITNHGSIVKSGGTGTSYLTQAYRNTYGSPATAYPDFLVSDGSISATSGTLQIAGNASYDTGASFGASGANGSGIYFYDGIQTLNASQALNALTVNTDVKGTGSLTVADAGILTWNSGIYSGAGLNVAAGGTLNLVGTLTMDGSALANAGTVNLNTGYLDLKSSATLANSGTVNLTGGYDLNLYDSTSMTNAVGGTIDLKADSSYIYAYNAYQSTSTPTLTNHGSIVKSGGTGTSYLTQYYRNTYGSGTAYPDFLVSDGSISATSGTLQIQGNASYNSGARFGAAGSNGNGIYLYNSIQTVNAGQTLNALKVNADVKGTGTLSVANAGTLTWNGGTYSGAGLDVAAGGTLDLAGTLTLDGAPLTNAGTVNLNTGYLDLKSSATLANSGTVNLAGGYDLRLYDTASATNAAAGTIDLKADSSYIYAYNAYQSTSTPTLTNHGSIVKSAGTGTSYLTQYYRNNNGSVAYPDFLVSDGSISAASGTLQIQGNASYNTGASFGAAGSNGNGIYFYDGIQTLNASQTLNALTVNTDVKGTGVLTVADGGTLIWNSGTYSGAGLNVAAGGTLNLVGTLTMNGTALANAGTVNLNTGYLDLKSSATLANSGTVNLTGGYDLRLYDTASATNAAGGMIDFEADGSYIYVYNAYQSTSTPTLTNHGSIVKSGGTGTSYLSQYYRNNNGSVAYPDFLLSDGSISAASGTLQIRGNASYNTGASFGAAGANGNGIYFYDGIQTLNASQTLNALTLATDVKGTGVLTVADGGTLIWNSGTYSGAGLTVDSGGTLNITGGVTLDSAPLANSGTTNLTYYLYLNGTAALSNSGTINIDASYSDIKLYDTSSITNNAGGIIALNADGAQIYAHNTSQSTTTPTLTNHGTIEVNTTGTGYLSQFYRYGNGSVAYPDFLLGDGSISVSSGSLLIDGNASHAGAFNISSGANIDLQGIHTLNSGVSFAGAGELTWGGIVNLGAPLVFGAGAPILKLTSVTINGSATNTLTTANAVVVPSGYISLGDNSVWSSSGDVSVTTSGWLYLNANSSWNNSGTIDIGSNSGVYQYSGSTFNNLTPGVVTLSGSYGSPITGSSGFSFNNAGTLTKLVGSAASQYIYGVSNTGTINVDEGSLYPQFAGDTNSGSINVAAGAALNSSGAALTNASTGTISGNGMLDLGTATLVNNGTLAPGTSSAAGTLSLASNLSLGTDSLLKVKLGGTSAGTYDKLAVTGNVTMGGTLNVSLLGGYVPVSGDAQSFLGMTGTATGTFATNSVPSNIDVGYNLYSGEAARTVHVASAMSKFFNNSANNLDWGTAANWSGGLPTASDEARIDTNFSVTHAYGVDTVGALAITSGNSLDVSGGSLTVGGNTTLGGTLTVSGSGSTQLNGALSGTGTAAVQSGTLAIDGSTSGLANLSLSGGTLTGTGNLTISNSFVRTGGIVGNTFSGLTITQASGALAPGALAVSGPVSLTASAGALALDSVSGTSIFGHAGGGDLILTSGASLSASGTGDALVLATGDNFVNSAGAAALSTPAGRWLVYSSDPGADTRGGLGYDFKQYGMSYGGTAYAGSGSGNGFIYSVAPTLTPILTGSVSKVYDGTTAATLSGANFATTGALDGDTIVLDNPASGTYADKHAGSEKSVSATVGFVNAYSGAPGVSVYGYRFGGPLAPSPDVGGTVVATATATGNIGEITQKPLVLAAAADTKVYDRSTTSTGTVTATGLVSGDSFTPAGQSFDAKDAGGRTLSVNSGYSISDGNPVAAGDNYAVSTTTAGGAITPLGLTVSGVNANNRVYDASSAATLDTASASLVGVISGDSVSFNVGSGSFADKNAGSAKPVTVSSATLSGTDAGNYTVAIPSGLTADITQAPLTVSATGVDRIYDATTGATATLGDNRLSGDVLALDYASAAFADKNVGTGKPVTVSGISVSGTDAGNYTYNTTASTTADITPASLTISATGQNKVYDASPVATVSLGDNRLSGDVLALAYASAAFADKIVGTAKPVTVAGISASGADAGNYTFNTTASTTANITPAALSVSGISANSKVYDGSTAAALNIGSAILSGVFAGDFVSVNAGTGSFADKNVGTAKPVATGMISLGGADAGNYIIVGVPTGLSANITPAGLVISAIGQDKVYDGTTAATVSLSDNRVNGDVLALAYGSAAYDNKDIGTAKPVTVTGINVSGADAGNYTFNTAASTVASITEAPTSADAEVTATVINTVVKGISDSTTSTGPDVDVAKVEAPPSPASSNTPGSADALLSGDTNQTVGGTEGTFGGSATDSTESNAPSDKPSADKPAEDQSAAATKEKEDDNKEGKNKEETPAKKEGKPAAKKLATCS